MTHAEQPEDINTRLNTIDEQLEQLGDEIDLIRTIQNANRREVRATSQTAARLERSITRLEEIARLHQQGLRIAQQEAERDREIFQTEIRRIWEYLLRQSSNGGSSPSN
jgi:predicted  nucleic acid-binding Zn-ribbon protein